MTESLPPLNLKSFGLRRAVFASFLVSKWSLTITLKDTAGCLPITFQEVLSRYKKITLTWSQAVHTSPLTKLQQKARANLQKQ